MSKFNKNDKVVIVDKESIWANHPAIVVEESDDDDTILVKIPFQVDSETKYIFQTFNLEDLRLETKSEALTENMVYDIKYKDNKDDYIKGYVSNIDIDGKEEGYWIFADTIEVAENRDIGQIISDALKLKYKVFEIRAYNFDKIVIADKRYTEDMLFEEYGDFLLGNVSIEPILR